VTYPLDGGRTENDAVIQVAQEAARAKAAGTPVEIGQMYAFPKTDGYSLLDLDSAAFDSRRPTPRRKTGGVTVVDPASFAAYYSKHSDDGSEVYVDVDKRRITAILDAHTGDGPRWQAHTLTLALQPTKAWTDWAGHDRKPMAQEAFADFIEDHLADIVNPSAADMLEVAQSLQTKSKVSFSSSSILASGARRLIFEEETAATAGSKGQLEVPSHFKIAVKPLELPVAEGEDPIAYKVEARFRYRIDRGALHITYLLDDPAAVMRDAVLAVVERVEQELGVTVLRGTPPPSPA
jgi:uncharacterized protein YfdQ (DUF2303 family)